MAAYRPTVAVTVFEAVITAERTSFPSTVRTTFPAAELAADSPAHASAQPQTFSTPLSKAEYAADFSAH